MSEEIQTLRAKLADARAEAKAAIERTGEAKVALQMAEAKKAMHALEVAGITLGETLVRLPLRALGADGPDMRLGPFVCLEVVGDRWGDGVQYALAPLTKSGAPHKTSRRHTSRLPFVDYEAQKQKEAK